MKASRLILSALFLTGCNLAPEYRSPAPTGPSCWKVESQPCAESMPCTKEWWVIFNDPCLNELEETALDQSPTLESAYQRIMEAESIADQSYAHFFPFVTLNPFLLNMDSLYSPSTFGVPISNLRAHVQEYTIPAVASYELDLFGRVRNGFYADKARADARIYAYEVVKLTLTTDVALTQVQCFAL